MVRLPINFAPYSSLAATRVLLLGSGELGKEVVISLQRYGVEVVAADRYTLAPAHQVAHRTHVLDMTDPHALRRLIESERPHFVVPEIEAIATDALLSIEHEGLAEIIPTASAVQLTMNREGIRRLAAEELGLPTSRYAFADTHESFLAAIETIGFPCFVKPVMSSSGKGQSLLRSVGDIGRAWTYAQEGGRVKGGRVIVEGKVDFDFEITLLTVRALDVHGELRTYFCDPVGHRQENGDYVESWQPQPMSAEALAEAQRIADSVCERLGGRGLFGVELFVKGDRVWFSEVSPRPHDTGMVTMVTQAQSEFELHARAVLGLPVTTTLRNPGASAVIYGQIEGRNVAFEGVERALAIPGTEIRLFGKPESFPRRRMGVALASGDDVEQARFRARAAADCVKPVRA
ncbi:formate-dependent phosphoribosylglycinamide formyltransferase [Methylococcus sp. EFPC2]|uniref:formate-dependent phosphoribosylglycinamide formyltransferase n=1 Tax=Methylococcus sp. EFPC2 TaxID=2812648 RepID=UPI0019689A49|nr:formate-dependent phosphoribosylglycinamide formyltransferase [Methylococcus sp. EFPC2]QSA95587.1 formate-dependent phosphoribosylglycinamide formyltransferase [Methylococcus sp. EFPC2]